ncbi:MAG TPA: MFS transporter, partial [Vicinamibacterales bacterium]|nr:MFS transporter [Vicinamibacterales bacterium]
MERAANRMTAAVALMAVFGLGIAFVIVGAISVEYAKALQIANIGDLTLALFLTSAIVQLIIGPLVDRFGYRPLAIAGFLISALSMFLLAVATGFQMALVACILLGVGAMCMNTVGNTLIPVVLFGGADPARASNFGNAFFGLGLVVTPLLFSVVTYKPGLFVLGAVFLAFLLMVFGTRFPRAASGYQFSMAVKLLGNPVVRVAALALFCYISLEASLNTWSKPYMTEMLGGDQNPTAVANAGLVLSL